jgi:hypothetical protein
MLYMLATIAVIEFLVIWFLLLNAYRIKADGRISITETDDRVAVNIDMSSTDITRVRGQKRVVLDVEKDPTPRT